MTKPWDSPFRHPFVILADPDEAPLAQGMTMGPREVAEMLLQDSFTPGTLLGRGTGTYVVQGKELIGRWVRYCLDETGRLVRKTYWGEEGHDPTDESPVACADPAD